MPATERAWRGLRTLLAASPGRLAGAARLALICALTAVATATFQTPSASLSAYCAFFYAKPDRMGTTVQAITMVLVVSLIVAMLFPIANLVIDHPAWRVATMALISVLMMFLASASRLAPVASVISLLTAYALDLLGSVRAGEVAARGLLYLILIYLIPGAITILVGLLLAPAPRRLVERELASRLRAAAAVLRAPGPGPLRVLERMLRQGEAQVNARLGLVRMERSSTAEELAALQATSQATVAILSAVQVLARSRQGSATQPLREALAQAIEASARSPAAAHGRAADAVAAVSLQLPAGPEAAAVATIGQALSRLARAPQAAAPAPEQTAAAFLAADAFSNPDHLRFALKTTAAAMFCYLTYSLLDWPGIHTAMITCYIVSLPTLADSVEKLTLRIAGCLLGAALGVGAMLYVVPCFTSVGALFLIVFAGAFAGAWLAVGSPRIAYAGFQLAFAFFLCVIQDTGPSFDLVVARDRIIGILLGNLAVYFVSTQLWPVSVARRIDIRIAGAIQHLVQMASAPDLGSRARLASQVHATLGAAADDLQLAGYEPATLQPSQRWLASRRLLVARAGALAGPLLVAAERGGAAVAPSIRRLDALQSAVAAIRQLEKVARATR